MNQAQQNLKRWRENPASFVREQFKVEPDAWQLDVLAAFANKSIPRISMQACAGPGKSAVLAWLGWNFLSCYADGGDHPKGAVVSITSDNLKDNLWPEFSKWQQKSPFLSHAFTWTKEQIFANDHPSTWFLSARSWPKSASPDEQGRTLSGLHSGFVLALIDESGAIPPTVLRAAEQALSTGPKFGKIVQAGNPLSRDGMLFAASNSLSHLWHVIRITGDPDDPKRSPRIDIEWAREQIRMYGRDNPWVQAYILGLFPASALNTLIGPDEVRDAMKRHYREDAYSFAALILGVDVAREGDDRSAIFPRQGVVARVPTILRNVDTIQGAGMVARQWQDLKADAAFIDNTGGFGGGWIDQLRLLRHQPTAIHFAGKADDPRYVNKRAEMWFRMCQWIKDGGALPESPELLAELTTPTYFFKGDRFQVEDKDQVKARLGRSPDLADALGLTFAAEVRKLTPLEEARKNQPRKAYSPFDRL